MKCTNCGADVAPSDKFCGACGQKVEIDDHEDKIKRCPSCDSLQKLSHKFCTECECEIDNKNLCLGETGKVRCKNILSPTSKFCGVCGKSTNVEDKTPDNTQDSSLEDKTPDRTQDITHGSTQDDELQSGHGSKQKQSKIIQILKKTKTKIEVETLLKLNRDDPRLTSGSMHWCGTCGGVVSPRQRFCGICGQAVEIDVKIKNCPNCDSLQQISEKFCTECGYEIDNEYISQVMSDIKSLGFETVQGFEEIMKKGSYKCYWNRVYLVGNSNIGKTTLAKVLVGDPVPEKFRQSTDGIWIYIGLAGMDIDEQKWIFLQKGSATRRVLSTMLMSLSNQEESNPQMEELLRSQADSATKPETITEGVMNANGDKVNSTSHTKGSPHEIFDREISQVENGSETNKIPEKSDTLGSLMGNIIEAMSNEKIRELVIEVALDGKYKMKIVPIDIWDFGGQKDYYMTHQLFITSRGIFVLMFNGSQNMHEYMPDLTFLPGHYGKPTIAVYIKHWVNSILTYCRRTKECFPKILFVATHKDRVPKDEVEKRRQYLITSIGGLFESHAGCGHLEYQNLLFIDARDKSDTDIAHLRELLIQRAIEHPRWGENMPTAWVPLELELSQEVENGSNIISRVQLEELNAQNKSFLLTPDQLESFLKIQHSMGKLIYFDEINLRNFIFLNPVYMIKIMRSIVTDKQFWPSGEVFTESHRLLRKEGRIEKKTIYAIWEQDEFSSILLFKDYVLEILIHLDIIVRPRTDFAHLQLPCVTDSFYLVPCMITNPDNTNYMAKHCNNQTSIVLAYTFVDDVIPPALSYRFLGSFLTMWNLKNYNGTRMIFCDLVVIEIDDKHDVVVQVKEKRLVVSLVHQDMKNKIVPTLASTVQECLTACIGRISEFYSSLSTESSSHHRCDTSVPFEIEYGVFCQSSICYFHHRDLTFTMQFMWKCQQHNTDHDVSYLRYWFAEKEPVKSCPHTCKGLGRLRKELYPSDQQLQRLVSNLDISTCRELAIYLGITLQKWKNLEYQFLNKPEDISFMALYRWKEDNMTASFRDLIEGLKCTGTSIHEICRVFREVSCDINLRDDILGSVPTDQQLLVLSNHIGNNVLQLGVELGLDVPQIEGIQHELSGKLLKQTQEILTRWSKSDCHNPSVRSLFRALSRIGKAACINRISF